MIDPRMLIYVFEVLFRFNLIKQHEVLSDFEFGTTKKPTSVSEFPCRNGVFEISYLDWFIRL